MAEIVSLNEHMDARDEQREDDHLRDEHGLVRVSAYVRDPDAAKKKSGAAERMKRMRERKREAGLVAVELPAAIAEAIKTEGVERVLAVDAAPVDREAEELGLRVIQLRGLRGWMVRVVLIGWRGAFWRSGLVRDLKR
jgi:hypothetical protein